MSSRIQIKEEKKSEIVDVQIMIGLQTEAEGIKDLPEKTQREMCGRKLLNSHHCPRKGLVCHQQCETTEKETEDTVRIPLGYVPYSRMIKVCRLTLITNECWEFILRKAQYMSGMF